MADLNYPIRMDGVFAKDSLILLGARIEEGINQITRIDIEFKKTEGTLDLEDLIGTKIELTLEMPGAEKRVFPGICASVEYLGLASGDEHFKAELRPWFWLLSRTADSRVYQEISVPDLFQQILGEYGFSADLKKELTGSYSPREFLLQYRETDLDFLARISEEEGIYFFFIEDGGKDVMVLADNPGAHGPIPGEATIPFRPRDDANRLQEEHVFDWKGGKGAPTGKLTLDDYNFEKPKADLTSASAIPKGKHSYKDYEVYDYPGKYRETSEGDRFAKFRMEAEAIHHHTTHAAGNVPRIKVGHKFKLKDHPRKTENHEYLVTRTVHHLKLNDYDGAFLGGLDLSGMEDGMPSFGRLEAVPATEQYRHRQLTKKPVIPGIQTALVVGPSGEEIHTDKYGRIKIQFHWDREGKKDDKSSCWVRTMMPWTGKNWGMIHVPRIGQEVVVDFEEGDPDRPIVIGMLYNADTMPPYTLPANQTQSGVKTNSSKGGGGFNELMMEDKKDAELVRFQAERDYKQIVKNDAEITVGLEHQDKGDMTMTVHRHLTETVKTGDHTFKVETGNQDETIKGNVTWTVEQGNVTRTVKQGNVTGSVDKGNVTETIKMGNLTTTLDMGNETKRLKMGNQTTKVDLGAISQQAMQKIEFKVGGSSIKIDPTGVTIKGPMIKIEGMAMVQVKAPMTQVSGDGILMLKGGITMIN